MFLIDTVMLSELRKRTTDLFLSVISIGEIERGIARQRTADPGLAGTLADWLDRVLTLYGDRVVPLGRRARSV
jgi:predicted nucleic acid-binding protein